MSFKIGDLVEVISEKFEQAMKEKGCLESGNTGVIEAIDDNWLGVPYKVKITGGKSYWAYGSELKLEKETAVRKKNEEIEIIKKNLRYAEKQLAALLEEDNTVIKEESKTIKYLKGRIVQAESRAKALKERHGDNPGKTHTYHGGWDLGYWDGLVAAYHNVLDRVESNIDKVEEV